MKFKYNSVIFLFLCIFFASCNGVDEPEKKKQSNDNDSTKITGINLGLEGAYTDEARAMSFDIKSDGPVLNMTEESMPSITIISNQSGSTRYYLSITWNKTAGKNHLYVKKLPLTKDLYNTPIVLNKSENWYIMGYVGGTFDQTKKQVKFDPNGSTLEAVSVGGKVVKPVPVFFGWTQLKLTELDGVLHVDAVRNNNMKDAIQFKALGMMMRVELTNKMDHTVKYRSIRFQSNVLTTTSGYYDLNSSSLPAVTNSSSGRWKSSDFNEPAYTFRNTSNNTALTPILGKGATYDKYFLVWGMPISSSAASVTHVLADASRLSNTGVEKIHPVMSSIYIWGSTNMPQEGSRRILKTILYRPKLGLEYFAKNYAGTNPVQTPVSSTATGIGRFTYEDITSKSLPAPWKIPIMSESKILFSMPGGNPAPPLVSFKNTNYTSGYQQVTINGEKKWYHEQFQNGSIIYGLRFDGDRYNNGRMQYSAYKYRYNADESVSIECVYLGPNYKGSFEDIKKDAFWLLHHDDIITRTYAKSQSTIVTSNTSTTGVIGWILDSNEINQSNQQYKWILYNANGELTAYHDFPTGNPNALLQTLTPVVFIEKPNTPFTD